MNLYIKLPVMALNGDLSNTELSVFIQLCLKRFQLCGNDYDTEFYLSDKLLSEFAGVSTPSVWKAKNKLSDFKLISYRISGKKTWYKILQVQ